MNTDELKVYKKNTRKEWGRRWVTCECGIRLKKGSIYLHKKSAKHLKNLEESKQTPSVDTTNLERLLLTVLPLIEKEKLRRIIAILLE